jgi:hypothetical protein
MLNSMDEFLSFIKLSLAALQQRSLHSSKMVSESTSKLNKVVMAT